MSEELAKQYLPKNAKKVFKGKIFDVYHWRQELFNGNHTTFEAIIRLGSVQIICVNDDNTITLFDEEQPHSGRFISFPGGQIDEGETPKQSALRELKEELGYECESIELWREVVVSSKIIWPSYYYIVKGVKKVQQPNLDAGEKIKPFNVSFEEFLKYTQNENFRNKQFSDIIFKIMQDEEELEKLKKSLFSN